MSPPQNPRLSQSLQESVAVLAEQMLEIKARATEDRTNVIASRIADQEFNKETYATKGETKPLVALFWTVLGGLIISFCGVLGTFFIRAMK